MWVPHLGEFMILKIVCLSVCSFFLICRTLPCRNWVMWSRGKPVTRTKSNPQVFTNAQWKESINLILTSFCICLQTVCAYLSIFPSAHNIFDCTCISLNFSRAQFLCLLVIFSFPFFYLPVAFSMCFCWFPLCCNQRGLPSYQHYLALWCTCNLFKPLTSHNGSDHCPLWFYVLVRLVRFCEDRAATVIDRLDNLPQCNSTFP